MTRLREYQEEYIKHAFTEALLGWGFTTVDKHVVNPVAEARAKNIKTGFIGRMNKHSASMQNYRTLNLDPTEWRRL